MSQVTLGTTGITVNKNGFGALPVQRVTMEEAKKLLRKAFESGITFFDTARASDLYCHQDGCKDSGWLLEGSGNQFKIAEDGLHRYLPIPQSGSLSKTGGWDRPV